MRLTGNDIFMPFFLRQRGWSWRWQNLNDGDDGKLRGGGWKSGRCWWRCFDVEAPTHSGKEPTVRLEWHANLQAEVRIAATQNQEGTTLGVDLPAGALYLTVTGLRRLSRSHAHPHRWTLFWAGLTSHTFTWLWRIPSDEGPARNTPRHHYLYVAWRDKLFGKMVTRTDAVIHRHRRGDTLRFSHEHAKTGIWYEAHPYNATIVRAFCYRPRLPKWFGQAIQRVTFTFEPLGIPIPGKGESDYDQGDSAVYSKTIDVPIAEVGIDPERVVEYATRECRNDIEQRRLRYGGPGWRPTQAEPSDDPRGAARSPALVLFTGAELRAWVKANAPEPESK